MAERSKAPVLDRGRGRSWVQIPAMVNLKHRLSFVDRSIWKLKRLDEAKLETKNARRNEARCHLNQLLQVDVAPSSNITVNIINVMR